MSACTNKTVLLKDKHRGRTLVGSESGTTPRPAILCRGSSWGSAVGRKSCGWRLGEKDNVEGQEGKAKTRALWSYFREAPHGVMQTHGQPPRPSMFAHLRLAAARRGQGGPRSEEPKLPKVGSRVSPATVHKQHNGRMAAWDNLNNGRGCRRPSSPSWAPRQRQQVLVHAFCRTVCMAIATLAAVNQFVFAYLHIRLKLSRTSRLQESFFELFRDGGPALAAPDRKLDGFKSRVSLPLLAGCLPCWFGSRPPLDE